MKLVGILRGQTLPKEHSETHRVTAPHTHKGHGGQVSVSDRKIMAHRLIRSAPSLRSAAAVASHYRASFVCTATRPPRRHPSTSRRLYSLDRPNSSPFQVFSSPSGASNESSPYGQSLEISEWPVTKTNTVLNIVPQGKRMVVERFGKLHAIHESGYFLAVPVVDRIAYGEMLSAKYSV